MRSINSQPVSCCVASASVQMEYIFTWLRLSSLKTSISFPCIFNAMYVGVVATQNLGHKHSHTQSFATSPLRITERRRECIWHADGRYWEKMENVEFRNFHHAKWYGVSQTVIFGAVTRYARYVYPLKNNTYITYRYLVTIPTAAFAGVCWLAEN